MRAIVFILRGCSAGWLGAYGNEWIATPNLDRLAAEGVTFDRHISDCPDPAAACRAWLTGQSRESSTPPVTHLLNALRDAGVPSMLVRANHPDTDAPDWYYAHWGEVFDARPQQEDRYSLDSLVRALPKVLDRAEAEPRFLLWIEMDNLLPPWNIRQDVFQAYVEDGEETDKYPRASDKTEDDDYEAEEKEEDDEELDADIWESIVEKPIEHPDETEPVTPWSDPPTGPFDFTDAVAREWLHSSLSALATGLDAELGLVFEQLRARRFDQTAAWLLTSDLGYPLGEHGQIGRHRPWLHEELVHLPLLLRLPDADEACRRVAGFTQPPDLARTILDLLGIPWPEGVPGAKSLLPSAYGRGDTGRDCATSRLELGAAKEMAIRTDTWALLVPTAVPEGEDRALLLYSKPDDHGEVNDVRSQNIEKADELEELLKRTQ